MSGYKRKSCGFSIFCTTDTDEALTWLQSMPSKHFLVDLESHMGSLIPNCVTLKPVGMPYVLLYHGPRVNHKAIADDLRLRDGFSFVWDATMERDFPNPIDLQKWYATAKAAKTNHKTSLAHALQEYEGRMRKMHKVDYNEYSQLVLTQDLIDYAVRDVQALEHILNCRHPKTAYAGTVTIGMFSFKLNDAELERYTM